MEPYLRNYLETFLSLAYIKIPAFRKIFLTCIFKKSNDTLEEWDCEDLSEIEAEELDDVVLIFDWQRDFYQPLKGQPFPELKEASQALRNVSLNTKWQ